MKQVKFRESKIAPEAGLNAWIYTYYVLMPWMHDSHYYTIKATEAGFAALYHGWTMAGYEVVDENRELTPRV